MLVPSKTAMGEMLRYGLDLEDCKTILEEGYEPRKRKKNTEEKWMDSGRKIFNIVVVKTYNIFYKEEIYLITHIGKFTKRK